MSSYNVAILGATGVVGQELVQILMERRFPVAKLRLLASARSAGRELTVDGEKMVIEEVTPQAFNGVDLAFFTAGASVSREFVDAARKAGTVVIDNTSAFRMDPAVPLVVPEVNAKDIHQHQGVVGGHAAQADAPPRSSADQADRGINLPSGFGSGGCRDG